MGRTLEDACQRSGEVISFHIQAMGADDEPILVEGDEAALSEMAQDYESEGHRVVVAAVSVEIPSGKTKRISATLSEYVLEAADRWAKTHGKSRSGLLVNAPMDYLSRHS